LLYQRQDMGLTDLVAMTGQLIAVDKAQQWHEPTHSNTQNHWASRFCPSSGIVNNQRTQRLEIWVCFRP
jgi:hypothetical protein